MPNGALGKWVAGIIAALLTTGTIALVRLTARVEALEARVHVLETGGPRFSSRDADQLRRELEAKIERCCERRSP